MLGRLTTLALVFAVSLSLTLAAPPSTAVAQARIHPLLESALARGGDVHAVVMFSHPVGAADKARLLAAGATLAIPYSRWPWAGVVGSPTAIRAIGAFADVTEMQWAPPLDFYTHESIPLIGADDVWAPRTQFGDSLLLPVRDAVVALELWPGRGQERLRLRRPAQGD
jgi:hypothetical protein